jgi:phospholipid transport system substrate-binding protein
VVAATPDPREIPLDRPKRRGVDGYSGEVVGEASSSPGVIVRTRIVKSNGEPVSINHLTRRNGNAWQVVDVYLDGTISELATRRSEFSSILRDRGIDGLITALNRKTNALSATVALITSTCWGWSTPV